MPMIDSVLRRAAAAAPDRIAVREWDTRREFSYAALDAAVSAFANWMRGQGFAPGGVVGIHLPNSIDFLIAQFASFRAGGVAAYVNHRLAASEAARQFKLGGARIIVTTADKARAFREDPELAGAIFVLKDGHLPLGHPMEDAIAGRDRHEIITDREDCDAIARFTSGSTGAPKGLLVTHRAWLVRAVSILAEEMPIVPFSSTLVLGPLSHQAGLFVLPTFLRFGTLVVMDGFGVDKVAAVLSSQRISCSQMVPTILHLVLEDPASREALRCSGLDRLIYGGSPIRRAVLDEALALLPATEFVQGYGSHEAGSISYLDGPAHRDPEARYSAGRPFLAAEIRVRKLETGGEFGEIQVKAPWLPHARITEAGREALTGEWASTGDLGELRDGLLFLHDRLNDVIISGGFNVYPLEVEAVLNAHPAVESAAIVSAPDESWGERVIAFVVPRKGSAFDGEALRRYCREHLANYKVPKEVHPIPEVPVNVNGKPDRRKLSQPMWEGRERRIN